MTYPPWSVQTVLVLLVVIAAITDFRSRRIPNWLVLTGFLLGLALNAVLYELEGLKLAGRGFGLAMLLYCPLYLLRAMGAGDVKLMAAVGTIVGAANWLGIFILTSILGGICAILLMSLKGRTRETLSNVAMVLRELAFFRAPYLQKSELDVGNPKAATLPHGVMIALGSLAFLAAGAVWAPK